MSRPPLPSLSSSSSSSAPSKKRAAVDIDVEDRPPYPADDPFDIFRSLKRLLQPLRRLLPQRTKLELTIAHLNEQKGLQPSKYKPKPILKDVGEQAKALETSLMDQVASQRFQILLDDRRQQLVALDQKIESCRTSAITTVQASVKKMANQVVTLPSDSSIEREAYYFTASILNKSIIQHDVASAQKQAKAKPSLMNLDSSLAPEQEALNAAIDKRIQQALARNKPKPQSKNVRGRAGKPTAAAKTGAPGGKSKNPAVKPSKARAKSKSQGKQKGQKNKAESSQPEHASGKSRSKTPSRSKKGQSTKKQQN
jgi:hypothetical protein